MPSPEASDPGDPGPAPGARGAGDSEPPRDEPGAENGSAENGAPRETSRPERVSVETWQHGPTEAWSCAGAPPGATLGQPPALVCEVS